MPRTNDNDNKTPSQVQSTQQEPLDYKLDIEDEDLERENEDFARYELTEIDMEEFAVDDLKDMEGEGPDA